MNIVAIKGNLTREPELRHTPSGVAVCDCGIALNERFKNAAGELKERVHFFDFTVWGKQAESLAEYMGKGSPVIVEGSLQLEQWENDKHEKRSKVSIRANRIEFLHRAPGKPEPKDEDAPASAVDVDGIPF
jgi:single-strand DNA-binding protein